MKEPISEVVEFEQEGVRFSIPKRITVRQQSNYFGKASALVSGDEWLVKYWNAAKVLIVDWECDLVKDIKDFDIDNLYDPKITSILNFVAIKVMGHMNSLDDVEKNS